MLLLHHCHYLLLLLLLFVLLLLLLLLKKTGTEEGGTKRPIDIGQTGVFSGRKFLWVGFSKHDGSSFLNTNLLGV